MDDGTVARLADDHFILSTTSANADRIVQHLEFCLQVLWPELDVQVTGVTEQWAQLPSPGRGRAIRCSGWSIRPLTSRMRQCRSSACCR